MVTNRSGKAAARLIQSTTGLPYREAAQLLDPPSGHPFAKARATADPLDVLPADVAETLRDAANAALISQLQQDKGLTGGRIALTAEVDGEQISLLTSPPASAWAPVLTGALDALVPSPVRPFFSDAGWQQYSVVLPPVRPDDVAPLVEYHLNQHNLHLCEAAYRLLAASGPYRAWVCSPHGPERLARALAKTFHARLAALPDLEDSDPDVLVTLSAVDVLSVAAQMQEPDPAETAWAALGLAPDDTGALPWTSPSRTLAIPVGHTRDGANDLVSVEVGPWGKSPAGPVGLLQGAHAPTLRAQIRSMVVGAAIQQPPDRLHLLVLDAHNGDAFTGLESIPHLLDIVTGVGTTPGALSRTAALLRGEILRRRELLAQTGELPEDVPTLLVIINDAVAASRDAGTPFGAMLTALVQATTDDLGIYVVATSPVFSATEDYRLHPLIQSSTFGISFGVHTAEQSNTVTRTPSAKDLPIGQPEAYVYQRSGTVQPITGMSLLHAGPGGESIEQTILTRLQQTTAATPRWRDPLTDPVVFSGLTQPEDSAQLPDSPSHIVIGVLDQPSEAQVLPYALSLDQNTLIIGDTGSGVTTTLTTIVTAIDRVCGEHEQIHLFDGDSDLRSVSGLPSVTSYTQAGTGPATDRLQQLSDLVEHRHGQRAETPEQSASEVLPRVFIVLDRPQKLIDSPTDDTRRRQLEAILEHGPSVSIHVIAGASGSIHFRVDPLFTQIVHLRLSRVAYPFSCPPEIRDAAQEIPHNVPGRLIDLSTGLHGRIALPR